MCVYVCVRVCMWVHQLSYCRVNGFFAAFVALLLVFFNSTDFCAGLKNALIKDLLLFAHLTSCQYFH